MTDIARLLDKPEFPRSSRYDPAWMLQNQMGPNALWLAEWLAEAVPLQAGMRVLDLGCGRAMTRIFMAREFGVRVWAVDWWIAPDSNWRRVPAAGVADSVFPLRAEAHALPFPAGFFDAVVSVGAYQYFGTDVLYLGYLSRFARPGGFLGVVVPGLMNRSRRRRNIWPPHRPTAACSGRTNAGALKPRVGGGTCGGGIARSRIFGSTP